MKTKVNSHQVVSSNMANLTRQGWKIISNLSKNILGSLIFY